MVGGLLALGLAAGVAIRYGFERVPPDVVDGGTPKPGMLPAPGRERAARSDSEAGGMDSDAGDDLGIYEHYKAGVELLESGNPAQAVVRLEKARRAEPEKCSIHEALGRAYFALGLWADAELHFAKIVDTRPTDDYAHYCLSRALAKLGRSEEARTHLRLARALRPEYVHYAEPLPEP